MLVITNTYTTEDNRTFPNRNQALIYAALKESKLFFEDYKLKMLVEELDKKLIVTDREWFEEQQKLGEALDFPTLQDTEVEE